MDCSPSFYPYTIEVTYKGNAASQSIEVVQVRNNSTPYITSIYGHGKNYMIEKTNICVDNHLYQLVCLSLLSDSWYEGSYFEVKAFGHTTVLHGSVDVGGIAIYYMHPFNPISSDSIWRWTDDNIPNWSTPIFNDSSWYEGHPSSFFPLQGERFYRHKIQLTEYALNHYSSFEIYIRHYYSIDVYIDGNLFLSQQIHNDSMIVETQKREGLHSYFNSTSAIIAIAIKPSTQNYINSTIDPFMSHITFLSFATPPSSRIIATSLHHKDFYAHPISSLIDNNRKTSWWFRGKSATVTFEFENPLYFWNSSFMCRGEFINEYSIISSESNPLTYPSSWVLYGSSDNIHYTILDSRSDEYFDYKMQKKSYVLNNLPRNYKYYQLNILNNGGAEITTMSLFALKSSNVPISQELRYNKEYIFYCEFEIIHIAPISSGFTDFSLDSTILPSSLAFNKETGTIHGQVKQELNFTVTVSAKNVITSQMSIYSFTVQTKICDSNHVLLQIEKVNQPLSSIEYYSISTSETTYISRGYDSFVNQHSQLQYYCVPNELIYLTTYIDKNALYQQRRRHKEKPGMLTIRIRYPSYDKQQFTDYTSKESKCGKHFFYSVANMYITEETTKIAVSPGYIISALADWKVLASQKLVYSWFSLSLDDSNWELYKAPQPLPTAEYCYFRKWFEIENVNEYTSLEVKFNNAGGIYILINGESCYNSAVSSFKEWTTALIPISHAVNGTNLIAVLIHTKDKNKNHSYYKEIHDRHNDENNEGDDRGDKNIMNTKESKQDGSKPFFRLVVRLACALEVASRPLDVQIEGDYNVPYVPSNLISSSLASYWQADFLSDKVTINFSFRHASVYSFTKYCITNTAETSDVHPHSWTLSFKLAQKEEWVIADQQSDIPWTKALQTQCFVITSIYENIKRILWKIDVTGNQQRVQAASFSLHCINPIKLDLSELKYNTSLIKTYIGETIVEQCPIEPYFSHYTVSTPLPQGLILNKGTGCISGRSEKSFADTTILIKAISILNVYVYAFIRFIHQKCTYPNSFLIISFTKENTETIFPVEINIFTSSWHIIRSTDYYISSTQTSYAQCLPEDEYFISIVDYSAQGDLSASWIIYQNYHLLTHGTFNPGFPQIWNSFYVDGLYDKEKAYWYYSLEGDKPPNDWYTDINASSEPWEFELTYKLPQTIAITQYYKSKLYIRSLHHVHTVVFYVHILAGIRVFLNGDEIIRFNLPSTKIHYLTKATNQFTQVLWYPIFIPVQFSSLHEGNNIIAIETHLIDQPFIPQATQFDFDIQFLLNRSDALIHADIIDMDALPSTDINVIHDNTNHRDALPSTDVNVIHDGNYYNSYYHYHNNSCQSVHFFTKNGHPEYISKVSYFFGKRPDAYPEEIEFYGRYLYSLTEIEEAKQNKMTLDRPWVKLLLYDDIENDCVHYGKFIDMKFYNKQLFNEYKLVLKNDEKRKGFDIAEIRFERNIIKGFCNIHDITMNKTELVQNENDYTSYIPSQTWYKLRCGELYTGNIQVFCKNGNWTEVVYKCRCRAPLYFKYASNLFYLKLKKFVSILPKVKGAELHFFTNVQLPDGLYLNEKTGEIWGKLCQVVPLLQVRIFCGNAAGVIYTDISVMGVNNHEAMLITLAIVMVILFFVIIMSITLSMKSKRNNDVEDFAEMVNLHVDGLSNEMRSFLLYKCLF